MSEVTVNSDVRGKILDVARELFIQKGYNGVSIRDIASASGTNIAMVNYYFGSKLNLFSEIFTSAFKIVTGKIFTIVESDLSFEDMIRQWIYTYYEVLIDYPGLPLFVMNAISQHREELMSGLNLEIPYPIFLKVENKLKIEIESGRINPTSLVDFLLNLVSLCVFPFALSPIAEAVFQVKEGEYMSFLENHKVYVADFVINAIKK
ncbi:TetR/AcrR family transcriptional regulator [Bacteroidales bacterium OttesenSCG-928-M11]|nr:TetR/AcrR family transcriptional regulator [Bacteroidales bacterium OttesenSCG-928-M11]